METSLEIRDRPAAAETGVLQSLLGVGGALAGIALRPVTAGVELGLRAERELRGVALRQTRATALGALDAILRSALAAEVVERVLASALARRSVEAALRGPLVEAAASDLARYAVAERVADELLDSAAMERLVVRVIDSRLLNEAVERLLQTDELWLLVDEIARSPSVAEAITRQSVGFVDELAGGVRTQSRSADTWLESRVRSAFRRRPRGEPGDG